MRSLDERCAGVKVALIRNDSRRPIEMYARMDTVAALLIGVVAARSTVELPLPVGTTRLFTFDTGSSPGETPPLTISYKCVVGAPRPARAA